MNKKIMLDRLNETKKLPVDERNNELVKILNELGVNVDEINNSAEENAHSAVADLFGEDIANSIKEQNKENTDD